MTNSKLITQRVSELPTEFFEAISNEEQAQSHGILPSWIAIAADNRYVTDEEGKPLLFIWAHRHSLLNRELELCMIATKHLTVRHAREARKLVWDWIFEQRCPIYAKCKGNKTRRFLEFMGFTKVEELEGTINYRAIL